MKSWLVRYVMKWSRTSPAGAVGLVSENASEAGPGAPGRTVTREDINKLPLYRYKGPVHLVAEDEQLEAAVRALRREKILGFDTESRPAFKKGESYPPAVVQLAGAKAVYVFQLSGLTQMQKLFSLLASEKTLKVGVALAYDVRKLQEIQAFTPRGFTDLEALTDERGIRNNGLRSLAAAVLGVRISKGAQRSNWSRTPLLPKQVAYAATDAWVSREIYLALQGLPTCNGGSQDA